MVISEAEIRRQVEREFDELAQRRATIYFCDWCKERIRFGEMCVVEEVTGAKVSKEVHVHARCYGEWWQHGEENTGAGEIRPTRMVK